MNLSLGRKHMYNDYIHERVTLGPIDNQFHVKDMPCQRN